MDGWAPFGEIKETLDWDDEESGYMESAGYTSLIYQITPEQQSEEVDMAQVLELMKTGDITGDTLVWAEGMDGWLEFDQAKWSFEWPEEEEEDDDDFDLAGLDDADDDDDGDDGDDDGDDV